MGEVTKIAWTDHTFNSWEGCARVSPGCEHCYAEARNAHWHPRLKGVPGSGAENWGVHAPRLARSEKAWGEPIKWNVAAAKDGVKRRVFCASLADVFEELPEMHPQRIWLQEQRNRLWKLIDATPNLIWLLLTKRPENVTTMVPSTWLTVCCEPVCHHINNPDCGRTWPSNVWIGTTVEDQKRADERLSILASIPAPVRFVSMEPQLEWVSLGQWLPKLQWVIQGGESDQFGRRSHARPFDMAWADSLHAQCERYGVPYFFKQAGHNPYDSREASDDEPFVSVMFTGKGDDPSEWAPHLRAQEVPVVP